MTLFADVPSASVAETVVTVVPGTVYVFCMQCHHLHIHVMCASVTIQYNMNMIVLIML